MTNSRITILDGGMGRELERLGAPFRQPEWSALAMIEAPEIVKEVHIGEERFHSQGRTLAATAGQIARAAADKADTNVRVAGSIPPLFGSYRADLYQPERASEIATPLIEGLSPYIDLWLFETQSLIAEPVCVKSIIDRLDQEKKPVWVSFSLQDAEPTHEPLLRSGETVFDAVIAMAGLGVDAILFNCCQPEVICEAIEVTRKTLASLSTQTVEIGAYANAFSPQLENAMANDGLNDFRADLTPSSYLNWAQQWQQEGATLIGGCCGIGPEHIAMLAENLLV